MIVGEIQPASGQVISLDFVPVARAQYIPLVVHVTPATTNGELCDRITDAVKENADVRISTVSASAACVTRILHST